MYVYIMYLYSSSDIQKVVTINPANVTRVQPALIINGFFGLGLVVEIAHEYVAPTHHDLSRSVLADGATECCFCTI